MFSDDGQYLCTYGDSCEVRQGLRVGKFHKFFKFFKVKFKF